MIVEEFAPKFHYKPGVENIVADTLSCYPKKRRKSRMKITRRRMSLMRKRNLMQTQRIALKDCLLYYLEILDAFPLDFPNLVIEQANNAVVQALLVELDRYEVQEFYGTRLVCCRDANKKMENCLARDAH
jgi:hypothetical protein